MTISQFRLLHILKLRISITRKIFESEKMNGLFDLHKKFYRVKFCTISYSLPNPLTRNANHGIVPAKKVTGTARAAAPALTNA